MCGVSSVGAWVRGWRGSNFASVAWVACVGPKNFGVGQEKGSSNN